MPDGLTSALQNLTGSMSPEPPQPDVVIDADAAEEDMPVLDTDGNLIRIEHPDGDITISLDGKLQKRGWNKPSGWYSNLCDQIEDGELHRITDELIRGIADDDRTRTEWLEDRAQGIRLMALKVEIPQSGGSPGEGAGITGISQYRDSMLKEATLRFQANARSELLPTDGPVKIRNDNNNPTSDEDALANALEMDFNHYLTATATEYYPDTDRMLLSLGFGGTEFKKVYFCPLRNRPVSETVLAENMIINENVTDIPNARRATQRVLLSPNTVRRLQIMGVYRDVVLPPPGQIQENEVEREKKAQEGSGVSGVTNPEDRDREIYECYCELNVKGFEHKKDGKETGLEIPYRVTIDVSSRQLLEIVRNYREDDQELPTARRVFVKYTFIPGFKFWGIGLLHILGNDTNGLTALKREMIDAGMFASFPGFLFSDVGGRQKSNVFRVQPGGGAQIATGGLPITDVVTALPYKSPDQAMFNLVQLFEESGQRLGGVSEQPVSEGKQEAPVGTTLAMIEQAQKVLNAVHKRLHASQCEEFALLAECFRDHPESFWQRNRAPAYAWDEQTFLAALQNYNLVPQADPNTSSSLQRMMKAQAVYMMAKDSPADFDPIATRKYVLRSLGINAQEILAPPPPPGTQPPEIEQKIEELKIKKSDSDARTMDAQTNAQRVKGDQQAKQGELALKAQQIMAQMKQGQQQQPQQGTDPTEMMLRMRSQMLDEQKQQFDQQQAQLEDENRDKDRQADMAQTVISHVSNLQKQSGQHQHDAGMASLNHLHALHQQASAPRASKAYGGAVNGPDANVLQLVQGIHSLIEVMTAEQEVVKDHTGRITGIRRKRPDEDNREIVVEIVPDGETP